MRKRFVLIFSILSLFCSFLLTSCATNKGASEAYQGETEKQIFNAGEEALRGQNYSEAIKRFEAVQVQYPLSQDTETAELHVIYAYYKKEEYPLAAAAADRFIRMHPVSPHVDYAYYMRGLSDFYQNMGTLEKLFSIDLAQRDSAQIQKAYTDFSELTQRFPNSRYTPPAHQYMMYLRNLLAHHELEVAEYYYTRKAYAACANRASEVVRFYQGSPDVPKALVLMVKCYRKMNLAQQEQQSLTVLEYNYPNSHYVTEAKLPD